MRLSFHLPCASCNSETMEPDWSLKKRKSKLANIPPNSTLVEVHEWVQPSHCHHHQHDDHILRHGQLLRWMDIAACLSGKSTALHQMIEGYVLEFWVQMDCMSHPVPAVATTLTFRAFKPWSHCNSVTSTDQ